MDLDPVIKVAAVLVPLFGFFSLWRSRREQVLAARLTLIREAWPTLAAFRLKVRHWADGLAQPEDFFREMTPVFEATLAAFHRAQLVLDPGTVDKLDQIFDDYSLIRAHFGNAQMCAEAERAAPGAYGDRVSDHRKKWRESADQLDSTMEEVHRRFQSLLHGPFWAWRWSRDRAAINAARRPWLMRRRQKAPKPAELTAQNSETSSPSASTS